MGIISANMNNLSELVGLAVLLFPEDNFDELLDVYKESLSKENEHCVLYQKDNKYTGYMHLSVRSDYVNGADTSPVAFVEAIYVLTDYRKQGIGKEFIEYAEMYAKQKGISQFASDCFIDNTASENFHKSCGFIEKERVICFMKEVIICKT
jgi:aminoglycoside 6'-N-acetyltransferase I